MRLLRPLLAATALLAAAGAVPAQARVPRPLELTATTVVSTARSGWVDVVLPEDVRVSPAAEHNPDVAVQGKGRFVGFWLQRLGSGGLGDSLGSTRLPAFLGGGTQTFGSYVPAPTCEPVPAAFPVTDDCTGQQQPTAILLHEGRYRLTVLADGSPLSVTLRLHGLDAGTTSVTPPHRLASAQATLVQRESVQDKLVTFGATVPALPASYAWVFAVAKGVGTGALDGVSACSRADQGSPPPFAFSPGCPGGDGTSSRWTLQAPVQQQLWLGGGAVSTDTAKATTLGLGGSFSGDSGRTFVTGLGVWMQMP